MAKVSDDLAASILLEDAGDTKRLRSLHLVAVGDAEVTSAMLRGVSVASLVSKCLVNLSAVDEYLMAGMNAVDLDYLLDGWSGARERDDVAYAALAWAYVEELRRGERKPSEALAARLNLSAGTVNQRVREARMLSLLTRAPAGKAGGALTNKARLLLTRWSESEEATERKK